MTFLIQQTNTFSKRHSHGMRFGEWLRGGHLINKGSSNTSVILLHDIKLCEISPNSLTTVSIVRNFQLISVLHLTQTIPIGWNEASPSCCKWGHRTSYCTSPSNEWTMNGKSKVFSNTNRCTIKWFSYKNDLKIRTKSSPASHKNERNA